ncbi:hypothetical protein ANN_22295 [Periplaneta americana]|uniref:Uncharacterized protein n=1 Tax=Periplaneta americana TaxID=6978 RepID=A0ABQ8S8I9_PERAM|nr:hypothetical protein ANN_22295 [Periplaneta americana]
MNNYRAFTIRFPNIQLYGDTGNSVSSVAEQMEQHKQRGSSQILLLFNQRKIEDKTTLYTELHSNHLGPRRKQNLPT